MHEKAVDEVPDDAAEDKAESYLAQPGVPVEAMPVEKQDHQCDNSHRRQNEIIALKQAPGRPRIIPVHEFEETRNNDLFTRAKDFAHNGLGRLIQHNNQQAKADDAPVGRSEDCLKHSYQENTGWIRKNKLFRPTR
jgi:hypothetical protein